MIEGTNSGNRLSAWTQAAIRPSEKRKYSAIPSDTASAASEETSVMTNV